MLSPNPIARRETIIALIVVSVLFLVMLLSIGYSAGYGKKVDGEVVYLRETLGKHLTLDYKRDGGEWGFGYFVPIGVVALFWIRRKEILALDVKPATWTGLLFLLLGFFLYWAGYRGEQKYFGYASLQILTMGAILWFLGWAWYKKLFWLWLLLGMMWPWRFMIEHISAPLQLIMVKMTSSFLKLIGVNASVSGSAILTDTPDPISGEFVNLDIDVACSGMRSLFALVMIGLIFAFIRVDKEWKRWILLGTVPLVAIAGNFVRMLMLYGGARVWGSEFAIGAQHDMSGYHMIAGLMVFVVALITMSLVVEVLSLGAKFFRRKKVVVKQHNSGG